MKTKSFLWIMLTAFVLSLSFSGCTARDSDEDDETYATRDYLIGIGKWHTTFVKLDGEWVNPYEHNLNFMLEFFNKKDDKWKVKIWDFFNGGEEVLNEGTYTVDKNKVEVTVDGSLFMRMDVTMKKDREMGATVTFVKYNKTLDVKMERTW